MGLVLKTVSDFTAELCLVTTPSNGTCFEDS